MGQWESPELIGAILAGDLAARHDPRWATSGAINAEQYEFWSWRCCGMACLRSVLLARTGSAPGIVTLALEALEAGGYRLRYPSAGSHHQPVGVDGLIYAPFVAYVAQRWRLSATVESTLSTPDVVAHLARGAWVMASVHPGIRNPGVPPPSQGGHLVLVHGLVSDGVGTEPKLVLHNPSGDTPANQAEVIITPADFDRFFARRAVVFAPAR